MSTLVEIIKEHIDYRRQISKLAKSDIIRTYRGADVDMEHFTLGIRIIQQISR